MFSTLEKNNKWMCVDSEILDNFVNNLKNMNARSVQIKLFLLKM